MERLTFFLLGIFLLISLGHTLYHDIVFFSTQPTLLNVHSNTRINTTLKNTLKDQANQLRSSVASNPHQWLKTVSPLFTFNQTLFLQRKSLNQWSLYVYEEEIWALWNNKTPLNSAGNSWEGNAVTSFDTTNARYKIWGENVQQTTRYLHFFEKIFQQYPHIQLNGLIVEAEKIIFLIHNESQIQWPKASELNILTSFLEHTKNNTVNLDKQRFYLYYPNGFSQKKIFAH